MAANAARAAAFRAEVLPLIAEIRADGITSLSGIARELNARGVAGANGGMWTAQSISNVVGGWATGAVPAHALDRASRY